MEYEAKHGDLNAGDPGYAPQAQPQSSQDSMWITNQLSKP
jgi:hypothetical protein